MEREEIYELQQWCRDNLLAKNGNINPNSFSKFINKIQEVIKITNLPKLNNGAKILCFINNIFENPKCNCGKDLKYRSNGKFSMFCSIKCSNSDKDKNNLIKKVKIENDTLQSSQSVISKSKRTKSKRTDEDNKRTYEKWLETMNNKDEYGNSKFILSKIKRINTCLEKYGVDNAFKSSEIKEILKFYYENRTEEEKEEIYKKRIATCLEKYGVEYYTNRELYKETCLEKYGVDNAFKSSEIKEIIYNTKIKNGSYTHLTDKEDKEVYYFHIKNLTSKNFIVYFNIINPNKLNRNYREHHLDHKYSIIEGFKNCILPWVISHPCNLELIPAKDNFHKSIKCSHTIDELYNKIEGFNPSYILF